MLLTISERDSIAFFEIVRQHRRKSDEGLKLTCLRFSGDLLSQLSGDAIEIVGERANGVTRHRFNAMVQIATSNRRNSSRDTIDTACTPLPRARKKKRYAARQKDREQKTPEVIAPG